jgi:hypothetical protein
MFSRGGTWLPASILLFSLALPARADEAANLAIAKLLSVGWSITPAARAAGDLQYQEVVRLAGGDTRGLMASWLVLMQQRRFDDALARLEEHLARSPEDLSALRAKSWIQAILKNHSASMQTADKISALVAARPVESESEKAAHEEAIGFLGRLLGYFGGPAAEIVNQDQRKAVERKVLSRLGESHQALYEEARNGVLDRRDRRHGEGKDADRDSSRP